VIKGFKEFILRGNVIDLAVAVVIGAAFTAIVQSLVNDVFNPILGALFDAENLKGALKASIPTAGGGTTEIAFGSFLAAVIQFLLVASVVYFALVLPINVLERRAFARQKDEEATPKDVPPTETELLIEIRDLLAGRPSPEGTRSRAGLPPAGEPLR
jgi:large conductance mechanosensitive channel